MHVKAPQQKVIVKVPTPAAGAPPAALQQTTAVAQEVLLVPRTVYVPYVQHTPVGVARLTSMQGLAAGATMITSGQTLVAGQAIQAQATSANNLTAIGAASLTGTAAATPSATADEVQRLKLEIQLLEDKIKLYQHLGGKGCAAP